MSNVIDLSKIPAPDVVEEIDYERVLDTLTQQVIANFPADQQADISDTLARDANPLAKSLQGIAYVIVNLRQRVNEAAQAVMMPYAAGADLEVLTTLFGVQRLTIRAADYSVTPPIAAIYESDDDLRRRQQLSLEGLSVAGPEGAYIYHALSADPRVLDASAYSPSPGEVIVTVLSRAGNGQASSDLLQAVEADVSAGDVRPLTDHVSVQSAELLDYAVDATLYVYDGPDSSVVVAKSRQAIAVYVASQHRLGLDITLSGVYAALHQPGVQRVALRSPADTLIVSRLQAAYCTEINVEYGGVDE